MDCNLPLRSPCFPGTVARLAAALLCIIPGILSAQVFEAETSTKEVVMGSAFELTFTLKDARGTRFTAPSMSDFKVIGGPSEMRGMTIINGRSTSRQSWSYELEPRRTGTFEIAAATVVADGKTLSTKPLTFKVLPARAAPNVKPTPGSTDKVFIAGELSRESVFTGQQLSWRIKLYTQLSLDGADIIELPDFEGFYTKEKRRFDTRVQYQTIRGKRYAVKTLHEEALFPLETGDIPIGAAKVRVGIEDPAGGFGGFLMPKPVLLQTLPVTLRVKPLPDKIPEDFSGGVGQYEWAVELDRDSISTDDALTLTMSVRGNGDTKRFAPPKLTLPAGLEVFDPKIIEEEEYENGEEVIHTKVLEYIVFPKEPGAYTLVPGLVFFDPDSNRFRTLTADSLPVVRVTAGKNYGLTAAPDTLTALPPAVPPETSIWDGIAGVLQSPWLWAFLALPILAFGFYFLWKKLKKTAPAKPIVPRARAKPAKIARDRFSNAARLLNGGNPRAFYDELFKSLQVYLAAKLSLTIAQMTQEQVRKTLADRNVSAGTIQNLLSVWQTCEQALFAGQTQAAQMESTWRNAEAVVQDLEKMPLPRV